MLACNVVAVVAAALSSHYYPFFSIQYSIIVCSHSGFSVFSSCSFDATSNDDERSCNNYSFFTLNIQWMVEFSMVSGYHRVPLTHSHWQPNHSLLFASANRKSRFAFQMEIIEFIISHWRKMETQSDLGIWLLLLHYLVRCLVFRFIVGNIPVHLGWCICFHYATYGKPTHTHTHNVAKWLLPRTNGKLSVPKKTTKVNERKRGIYSCTGSIRLTCGNWITSW